jgi:hypothetical protein
MSAERATKKQLYDFAATALLAVTKSTCQTLKATRAQGAILSRFFLATDPAT